MQYALKTFLIFAVASIITTLSFASFGQSFVRMELRPLESMTLTTQQFLTGEKNGKPAILAGELRIPKPGSDRLPAVILVHGSGGLSASQDRWAQELNSIGVATLILDVFSGRGIISTVNDQSQLDSLAMLVDTYRALASLAAHPRIDPNRIAVMGFSKGAVPAIYTSNERFRRLFGPANVQFAAHIGLYTPCNVHYLEDDKTSGKPIRMFHGIADDYVSIEPCRAYVERLKKTGADVLLAEYPDAYHAYDAFMLTQPIKFPQGQTTRRCWLEESANGQILNSKTGSRFDLNDPCVEKGPQVAYNAAAYQATVKAVKEFLTATFRLQ
jgi:dienelactone hydrolase